VKVVNIITRGGWMYSAGGTGPYLSLKARLPELHRQEVDHTVFRRFELFEVPCVRSATMLVPRRDLPLALAAGRRAFGEYLKKLVKLGVTVKELEALAEHVMRVLGRGAIRSADQLRGGIPAKMIRELGEAGKQLGFATTLPVALRLLVLQGRITRLAEERRLDGKIHFYRPADFVLGPPPDDLDRALAERYVAWSGSTHVDDFAWWAGITKRAAKSALAGLEATGEGAPVPDGIVLLPYRDNHFALRHGTTPEPHHNTIVEDGALIGLWEYDHESERIVASCQGKRPRELAPAIAALETFIREELGDHRFYAFDHGSTRAKRIAEISD
jgi:Winged helix DNA-binding domain